MLASGHESHVRPDASLRHASMTQTLDAATWGVGLAALEARGENVIEG